ncbi:hypothetical protein LMG3458_00790 [Achromobacter deleyi]|uniref:Tripartite tricarboxylate transporter substrate binding protein n=1 Tax=Achromobacter deleyi TaxID=1353891 RepID=A0A6S6ZB16_9BURK|nr:tripartite tricarboxylate transporter substrate binding protein [Achromobacter deleyi]CAB3664944.1 hypothetical protein LMG3458_00790 [Achromobacter deleyi]CAB3823065.1 hypothetical protein LMG3481_00349 [Achromobacter deleyi]CAB3834695.1 hypothetical protein LMG3482_00944 [Achromobacter deleyi]CAB3926057.1 hypothetical protein LMG3412_05802 [Achromobacter deleyi]
MFKHSRAALLASLAVIAAAAAPPALAQVRLIVPFAAAGTQDLVARAIQPALGQALGQTIVVENRAGAGGTVGMAVVATSPPDGNTMALVSSSHNTSAWLYPKLPYDAQKSFAPAALIGRTGFALAVANDVPASSAGELIAYAKAHPEGLNYASAGNGSAGHLGMARFLEMAGIPMQHIPYKSTGEAINDVLAGRAQVIMAPTIGIMPFIAGKRLKVIGLTSTIGRSGALAQVPLVSETGLPGFTYDSWYGLLLPAATPRAVVEKINAAAARAIKDPAVVTALDKAGIEPASMSVDAFAAFFAKDYTDMRELVRTSGARVE